MWPDLVAAVAPFLLCSQSVARGMTTYYLGISAQEAHTATQICDVPREDCQQVVRDVIAMGRVVAEAINARMARAAGQR